MSHIIAGVFGARRQRSVNIRHVGEGPGGTFQDYDALVDSFGTSVVSYWKFANTGTDEKGIANATITGFPELNVPTIVDLDRVDEGATNDGICIAWPGTVGEYAQAAHNAAHKTASGSIVVTFQCDSLSDKSVLVCADASGAAGGLSVEVNTDGSPRAFLRNTAGTPIILLGLAGDVVLNSAYTMIFKWGAEGLSLALWNDVGGLVRRRTNVLADGVVGTSVIRFGAWHTDVAHHDGPYGRVIWLNRRITDSEEAILARARTVAREPVQESGWLGIGPDPDADYTRTLPTGSSVIYVATNGNDTSGNGSVGNPYRTIAKGIASVSSGANNGVVIRGGTYQEKNLTLNKSGTSGNKLKLMAYPNETVIISNLYNLSGGWTTHNSSLKQYNSVVSISETGSNVAGVFRWTGPDGLNDWWGLGSYLNTTGFNAGVNDYFGPGVRGEGGKIRLRIQHPVQAVTTLPNSTWTWNENSPTAQEMRIFPDDGSTCFRITANHVEINGIQMLGYSNGIRLDACNNVNIINCYVLFRRSIVVSAGGTGLIKNILFDKLDAQGCAKSHLYLPFREYKGTNPRNFLMDIHTVLLSHQQAPFTDIEIKNCTHLGCLQGIRMPGRSTRIHVHHNHFWNRTDDGSQCDGTVEEYELHHNYWHGCHWGPQNSSSSNFPGRIWIHHEVIDNSEGVLTQSGSWGTFAVFSRHVGGATWAGFPIKMWNCTILCNAFNTSGEGQEWKPGISYLNDGQNTTGVPHDVFNCIMMMVNSAPGQSGGSWSIQRHDHYNANVGNDNTTSRFDGCCLWRAGTSHPLPLFESFKPNKTVGGNENYVSLAAWKGSGAFTTSKAHYSPGWHANSFEENPSFAGAFYRGDLSAYIPQNTKCATNGVSLVSIKNSWPGQANIKSREGLDVAVTYIGALKP